MARGYYLHHLYFIHPAIVSLGPSGIGTRLRLQSEEFMIHTHRHVHIFSNYNFLTTNWKFFLTHASQLTDRISAKTLYRVPFQISFYVSPHADRVTLYKWDLATDVLHIRSLSRDVMSTHDGDTRQPF